MNANLNIRAVNDRAALRRFVDFPEHLYRDNPLWAPALRSAQFKLFTGKTAFFEHAQMGLFLAERGGEVVGRIAAIHNRAHNEHYHDTVGFFGFFECANDPEAAQGLMAKAQGWLHEHGLTAIRGPVNPSMNHTCGLLIEGYDRPPMALMPYNPPYYRDLLENLGFAKIKDMFGYLINDSTVLPGTPAGDRMVRLGEALRRRHPGITVRTIDMSRYQEEVLRLMAVFETARRNNWGYVPLTKAEILETAHELRRIIDPAIVLIAEVEGRAAGAFMSIPNFNIPLAAVRGRLFPFGFLRFFRELKRVTEIRLLGVAALEEDRAKGITALLFVETLLRGLKRGYRLAEASWVLEDNQKSIQAIQGAAAAPRRIKTYRIFEKAISI